MDTRRKGQAPDKRATYRAALASLLRSWFELSANERSAVLLLLGLFLLGMTVRWWHLNL